VTFYNTSESIIVDTTTYISFADFDGIKKAKSPYDGVFVIDCELNDKGAAKFKEMTSRNLRKQICFVIDDKIIAAPMINQTIPNGQIQMMIADKKGIELIMEYFKN
jgi:preprotein translocase subunit SecD